MTAELRPTRRADARSKPQAGPASALATLRLWPSRARGQNFLVQAGIARKIVACCAVGPNVEVVEIGPGLGALTGLLLAERPRRLTLIELDRRLAEALSDRFGSDSRVRVVNADFLKVDPAAVVDRPPIVVVGNLPFSVGSAILERLSRWAPVVQRAVLMFQREVAERIRAKPGSRAYGALSVLSAFYWQFDSHFRVGAGNFYPRPKVDAEVLVISPRRHSWFEGGREKALLKLVRAAFAAPRKTLRRSLSAALCIDAQSVAAVIEANGLDERVRPGDLSAADYARLLEVARRNPSLAKALA